MVISFGFGATDKEKFLLALLLTFCPSSPFTIGIFYSNSTAMCFHFSRNTDLNFAKTSGLSLNFD